MTNGLKYTALSWLLVMGVACSADTEGEQAPAPTDEPPVEQPDPVDPRVPTSMDDCDVDGEIYAGQAPMRLMTRYEFDNTIRDLLGLDGRFARESFPPENASNGFENNTDSHKVNPLTVRNLMEQAEIIAPLALEENREGLLSCEPSMSGCGQTFVEEFVTRAFRRPPTDEELQSFQDLFAQIETEYDFETAMELTVQAVLQSPQFLYRIELTENRAAGSLVQVDSYEMASRLSYFLWATMPDEELMRAAETGELESPDGIEAQARRMLQDPKAQASIEHFYRQWLKLDALGTMVKDETMYPQWNPEVTQAWKDSLYQFIQHVHEGNGDVKTLLSSRELHIDERLADIYGVEAQDSMAPVTMPAEERAGLLTHPALMALLAHPNMGSPIHRGIFVRERLLCQKLPSPPDDIQIEPPDPDTTATTREIFTQHSEDPSCAGCHRLIDPIGFGFENYDAIGRYRTTERGRSVDNSGELGNTADPNLGGEFNGAVELTAMLAEAREVEDCIADHWFTFAIGHPETEADMCAADEVRETFAASGGTFEDLLIAIVLSDTFRYRTIQVEQESTTTGGE